MEVIRPMASRKPSSGGHYRSAITGRFVKPQYAKTHPKTTVREK
jgi:hypothetical protein